MRDYLSIHKTCVLSRLSEFLPERKWFRSVIFSDSMPIGRVDFSSIVVFAKLPEGFAVALWTPSLLPLLLLGFIAAFVGVVDFSFPLEGFPIALWTPSAALLRS